MKRKEEMTQNERLVRSIIIAKRNDIVGSMENMALDYTIEQIKEMGFKLPTREEVIEEIYDYLMNGKDKYVLCPNNMWGIEKKHIHFMGEKFVRELIIDRVDADIEKNGWSWL